MTLKQDPFSFSIIIPTFQRPGPLEDCLESLLNLKYPQDLFEIIVVNDGGHESLEEIILPFKDKLNVQLLTQTHGGPGKARNAGAAQASGEYVAFLDDDCRVAQDWLEKLRDRVRQFPDQMIGGHTVNALSKNIYSEASQLLVDYIYAYYNPQHQSAQMLTSNNMTFPLKAFLQMGGFDVRYTSTAEDRDICDRWLALGNTITFAPEIIIEHAHELNLKSFWRQHFRYGRGARMYRRARAKRDQRLLKIEPFSFYVKLIRFPFKNRQKQRFKLSLLMILAQIANFIGFLSTGNGLSRAHNNTPPS